MSNNPQTPLPEGPDKIRNLTLHRGTVKPNVTAAPLAGYKVVVFEKISGGTRFITILNPEDQPLKEKTGFFSPHHEYNCYAVSSDTNLNFIFNTTVTLSPQHQQIDLKCTVYYYVSSPKHIVLRIDTDPLKRIQEEIERKLQQNILHTKLNIEHIQNKNYQTKDTILPYPTLNQLREFARDFGIIINDIDMTCTVPPKYLEPEIIREDHLLRKKTADVRQDEKNEIHKGNKENLQKKHELEEDEADHNYKMKDKDNLQDVKNSIHQQSMENMKHINAIKRDMVTLFSKQIDKTDLSIIAPETMMKEIDYKMEGFIKMLNKISTASGNTNAIDTQLTATSNKEKYLLAESNIHSEEPSLVDEVKQFLSTLQSEIEGAPTTNKNKDQMQNSIDHLRNELEFGGKADPDNLKKYMEKILQHIETFCKFLSHTTLTQESKFKEKMAQLISKSANYPSDSENIS